MDKAGTAGDQPRCRTSRSKISGESPPGEVTPTGTRGTLTIITGPLIANPRAATLTRMPLLLLLNGPPGIGKSTLARRYVRDRPLALCLDIDGVRRLIGRWDSHETESGLLARTMALEMARVHLLGGHDVAVPQFLGRAELIEQLETVAFDVGAGFCEVVLMDSKSNAVARFHARGEDADLAVHHLEAVQMAGGAKGLSQMYDRLQAVLAERPRATVVHTRFGETEMAYQGVLAAIAAPGRALGLI